MNTDAIAHLASALHAETTKVVAAIRQLESELKAADVPANITPPLSLLPAWEMMWSQQALHGASNTKVGIFFRREGWKYARDIDSAPTQVRIAAGNALPEFLCQLEASLRTLVSEARRTAFDMAQNRAAEEVEPV